MRSARLFIAAGVLVVGAGLACTSDSITDSQAPFGLAIRLTPSVDTIFLADSLRTATSVRLVVSTTSFGLPVVTPKGVEWTSANPAVAAVSFDGVVTPVGVGTTTITARVNDARDSATIVVPFRRPTLR